MINCCAGQCGKKQATAAQGLSSDGETNYTASVHSKYSQWRAVDRERPFAAVCEILPTRRERQREGERERERQRKHRAYRLGRGCVVRQQPDSSSTPHKWKRPIHVYAGDFPFLLFQGQEKLQLLCAHPIAAQNTFANNHRYDKRYACICDTLLSS